MDRRVDRKIERYRQSGGRPGHSTGDGCRNLRKPEFEIGRLRVPDEATHRLLLKAGEGGSY